MKKLLVLGLVLSLSSMVCAKMQISVNGARTTTEVFIGPPLPDGITIGIWTDALITYHSGGKYALVVDSSLASIDYTSGFAVAPDSGFSIENTKDAVAMGFLLPAGENGLGGSAFTTDLTDGVAADMQLFELIAYTANAPGTATLKLYESADGSAVTLVDSITIHQVPEPITMTLLGLGGLFLRRRSK
jgi:hypothetical protein